MKKLLFVFGTRPEAIKMIPIINKLKNNDYDVRVCTTGQHKEMLSQVLDLFDIKPDYELNIMQPNQTLADISATILKKMDSIYSLESFDMVFVHGDTSTTLAASLSAFYQKIPVAHIEAGLRTYNMYNPWPEEINRQVVSKIATYHFAPTEQAKDNLLSEGVSSNIIVTGNTVIDALYLTLNDVILPNEEKIKADLFDRLPIFQKILQQQYILVTGHRRENIGKDFIQVCQALKTIALNNPEIVIVYPVHLNPNVQKIVYEILEGIENIYLLPPLPYLEFIFVMNNSYLIVTDSGGIQEEAPSLGKPVLVTRNTTERPEAVNAGVVKLVGTDMDVIIQTCQAFLDDRDLYMSVAQQINPYGDGKASERILNYLNTLFKI